MSAKREAWKELLAEILYEGSDVMHREIEQLVMNEKRASRVAAFKEVQNERKRDFEKMINKSLGVNKK